MSPDTAKPEAQQHLDELAALATSEDDRNAVAEWQKEIDAERKAAFETVGREVMTHTVSADGVVMTHRNVEEAQAGQATDNTYGSAGRRS